MGFLKKASSTLFGSSGPKYSQDASAITQQYGVQSDLGNMSVVKNPDGTYSKKYESSANDQLRNNLIGQGLGSMSLDPTAIQDAYYNQATRLLNNQFDRERTSTDTNLINRGIQVGSDQYNQVMGDLADRQNATLQDIANQAVYMGDQNIGQKIGNINSLGAGRDIFAISGMGGGNNAYDSAYQGSVYNDAQRQQRNKNVISAIGALAGVGSGLF